ncbi:RluA family pseudouridine synthase [soil metagenome]
MPTFQVNATDAGTRLDIFLGRALNLSRREVVRALAAGLVNVDGKDVSARDKGRALEHSTTVAVTSLDALTNIVPEPDAPFTVLFEAEGCLVVDKPPGVPVLPQTPFERGTLLNVVVARYPQLQGVGEGGLKSGVVHRIDTDTSGALLLATSQEKWTKLRAAFTERRVSKTYRALVQGRLTGAARETMSLVVARHRPARVRVLADDEVSNAASSSARVCTLQWRALETFQTATLVEINLETGFLHQIRAMFAHNGHPVLGDAVYGTAASGVPRQMLHASRLELEGVTAYSPDPADFAAVLTRLRERSA